MSSENALFLKACESEQIINSNNIVYIFTPKKTESQTLLKTGYFDGTETFIRLTLTKHKNGYINKHYTIHYKDGTSFKFDLGDYAPRIYSSQSIIRKTGELIYNAAMEKFGKIW